VTLQAFLAETRQLVDHALDRWLPPATQEPVQLHEAMRYAVFAGGKRLRPAIARAACLALGGEDQAAVPVACALEMLHTYSLIHDDLPAIDDDDLRRGRASCHKQFGDATAILAGDALQTEAFALLANQCGLRMVAELTAAAGTRGMVGGEIADIEAEGQPPERERVESIHERKTAALFAASARMGAIAAGGPDAQIDALGRYGRWVGLAFQIVDDLLDETADAATLGKSPGKDRASRKMTYPAAVGVEAARSRAAECVQEACAALGGIPDPDLLAALAEFAVTRIR